MGTKINYNKFLKEFDKKLGEYYFAQKDFLCCQKGCSNCCEKGDYPISEIELRYLMQGYLNLENDVKIQIQKNFHNMKKGEACPFLINKTCSVYEFRPIICRVHGIAYLCDKKRAKVPYCVNDGLNYANFYKNNELLIEPIKENLDTQNVLKDFDYGEIRNLYDWIAK